MKREIIKIAAALVLLIAGFFLEGIAAIILFALSFLLVGASVVKNAAVGIFRGEFFDESFLMTLASVCAFCIGEFPEGVAIMLFYQVGELFCEHATNRSRESITALMDIKPEEAFVLRAGELECVHPSLIEVGETIVVSPGQKVPVDGKIIKGATSFDTSALTGEAVPRDAAEGDKALGGFININAAVHIEVESTFENSAVSKILEMVEKAADKKSKEERFITRFSKHYTPIVVIIAALLAVLPPLITKEPFSDYIYRALAFLVVSCPCALVVSVPITFFGGIGGAAKKGILIKGSNVLSKLSRLNTVVFDKTGTLTSGEFEMRKIHSDIMEQWKLLDITACAELHSTHPVSAFIKEAYGKKIDPARVEGSKEYPGYGISATVDGKEVFAGNEKLMRREGFEFDKGEHSGTVIHVACGGLYAGYIVISDAVKKDSARAIKRLMDMGIKKIAMLTGDTGAAAKHTAEELGITEYYSGLLPGDKLEKVEKMARPLAFVGDGINDAPVIAGADVGFAMGALGSDAAIEAADVVLMNDTPISVSEAVKISVRTLSIAKQNIVLSLLVKFAVMILCGFFGAHLWYAVFADVGVCVIAVLNALRALKS